MKTCYLCRLEKPTAEFWKNRSKKDGLYDSCKLCSRPYFSERNRVTAPKRKARSPREFWARNALNRIRKRANELGVPFGITMDELLDRMPERCPIFGTELIYGTDGNAQDDTASVDRLICDGGYVSSNIVVMSFRANRMKSDASLNEIEQVAMWALVREVSTLHA